jgi:hypothetical protein
MEKLQSRAGDKVEIQGRQGEFDLDTTTGGQSSRAL